jgi:hypothetical protein
MKKCESEWRFQKQLLQWKNEYLCVCVCVFVVCCMRARARAHTHTHTHTHTYFCFLFSLFRKPKVFIILFPVSPFKYWNYKIKCNKIIGLWKLVYFSGLPYIMWWALFCFYTKKRRLLWNNFMFLFKHFWTVLNFFIINMLKEEKLIFQFLLHLSVITRKSLEHLKLLNVHRFTSFVARALTCTVCNIEFISISCSLSYNRDTATEVFMLFRTPK